MAQLQPGIQVEVTPIKQKLYIEIGPHLSNLLDSMCKNAIFTNDCEFEITIKQGDTKVRVRAKG